MLRYIHQNPTKAGICKRIEDYAYSSYSEYTGISEFVDTDYALQLATLDEFIGLNHEAVDTPCLDISAKAITRVTDEQARALIKKIAKCDNASDFQNLDVVTRDKYLKRLRDKGLSIRQLSRLTGISFSIVRKF